MSNYQILDKVIDVKKTIQNTQKIDSLINQKEADGKPFDKDMMKKDKLKLKM